jgi:hypothetical protein
MISEFQHERICIVMIWINCDSMKEKRRWEMNHPTYQSNILSSYHKANCSLEWLWCFSALSLTFSILVTHKFFWIFQKKNTKVKTIFLVKQETSTKLWKKHKFVSHHIAMVTTTTYYIDHVKTYRLLNNEALFFFFIFRSLLLDFHFDVK